MVHELYRDKYDPDRSIAGLPQSPQWNLLETNLMVQVSGLKLTSIIPATAPGLLFRVITAAGLSETILGSRSRLLLLRRPLACCQGSDDLVDFDIPVFKYVA